MHKWLRTLPQFEMNWNQLPTLFIEQLEAANWESPQLHGISNGAHVAGPHRRVSPAWMTGGQRMGYGYNLVDNAEEHSPKVQSTFERELAKRHFGAQPTVSYEQKPYQYQGKPHFDPNDFEAIQFEVIVTHRWQWMWLVKEWVQGKPAVKARNRAQHIESPISAKTPSSAKSFYIEDVDETLLSRWAKASRSTRKPPQPDKYHDSTYGRNASTSDASPLGERRFSMDQTNSRPSVYFDPSHNKSADKLNGEPSRSRSGRWILGFPETEKARDGTISGIASSSTKSVRRVTSDEQTLPEAIWQRILLVRIRAHWNACGDLWKPVGEPNESGGGGGGKSDEVIEDFGANFPFIVTHGLELV
ncbi:uncharacterized protein N7500_010986 [Penicillium coprophilum]|uniref:uncharacterized protein n=1 Tax=Penicillium coprophilum TaxID=36646 RepID=UPI002392EED1|nr:uncharacterized protein N7500_010986 [Penicillium coprophilum]KAJ5150797.1 hypothetical protein N7500_010986 [Penicillium coprophilum]